MNFPVYSAGDRNTGEAEMVRERQEALGRQGFEVVRDISFGLARLQAGGVIRERPDPGSERDNQTRYVPTHTDIEGGWQVVRGAEGREKLMRLTVLHPRDVNTSPEGSVEIELGEKGLRNGKVIAEKPSRVLLRFDRESKLHVRGTEAGFRFDVDHPNQRSMYADLSTAERVMNDAQAGVADLLSRMPEASPPVAAPEAPQQ